MSDIAMSDIDRLRQNDPGMKSSRIPLQVAPSDADLAQALEQNPFVTEIELSLRGEQRADWTSLLGVIATRVNLEKLVLKDASNREDRTAPAALVRSILGAIQQNTAVQRVELWWLRLPSNISTFVDNASSITSFSLSSCDMDPVERQQGARTLAAALQRSTNVESLKLNLLDDIYTVPILQGLRSNVSVKTLVIGDTGRFFTGATALVIQQLLISTASIQTFGLQGVWLDNNNRDMFRTFTHCLIQSPVVCGLEFRDCRFLDEESTALLRSILQDKQNLTSLCLNDCSFIGGQVRETIVSILSRLDAPLRSFELDESGMPDSQFRNLCRAVEKSKLDRFVIGTISTLQRLRALADSIPLMRIKELKVVVFIFSSMDENTRQHFLQAVKNNFSLRSMNFKSLAVREFLSANDKARLVFYADRNERLDQWADNPETVEQSKVWPDALGLAQRAGPDSLFRGLRSVLESDYYMSLQAARKRKRPQYYAPS